MDQQLVKSIFALDVTTKITWPHYSRNICLPGHVRSACYSCHRIWIPHLWHVLSRSIVAETLRKAEHTVNDTPLHCVMCGLTHLGYNLQNINMVWETTPFLLRRINVHRKSLLLMETLSIDFKLSKQFLQLWYSERFCSSSHSSL